ncbi:MAG: response regulator [Syntrophorhabdaceae bacterium]|nr:response regulator [Syntrophorhabdaceae bacterium]MDD4195420.1 response regulator [Syntrophorhabdaceae bacterium]HOC45688.1 response regulator [Syntrophorhabdaceae bacterium]
MAKRILIIDDDVDFVDLNKAVLESNGFEVETAFSAREGMDKVQFDAPDLILLDLMLEKHDTGFSFAKSIKADPRYKNIPILMISAVASETGYDFSQEQDGYWMKTDGFVPKPVEPDVLVQKINALINK